MVADFHWGFSPGVVCSNAIAGPATRLNGLVLLTNFNILLTINHYYGWSPDAGKLSMRRNLQGWFVCTAFSDRLDLIEKFDFTYSWSS